MSATFDAQSTRVAEIGGISAISTARVAPAWPETRLLRETPKPDHRSAAAAAEIERLANAWPEEFRLGYRFGFRGKADPPCDRAGYPLGLHAWPLPRRNAWWCGFSRGRVAISKVVAGDDNG